MACGVGQVLEDRRRLLLRGFRTDVVCVVQDGGEPAFDSSTCNQCRRGGGYCRHHDGAAIVVGVFAASVRSVGTIVDLVTWLQYRYRVI
jgi:hypothetical protein